MCNFCGAKESAEVADREWLFSPSRGDIWACKRCEHAGETDDWKSL